MKCLYLFFVLKWAHSSGRQTSSYDGVLKQINLLTGPPLVEEILVREDGKEEKEENKESEERIKRNRAEEVVRFAFNYYTLLSAARYDAIAEQ